MPINSNNVYNWNIASVYAYNGAFLTPTVVASSGSPTFSPKDQLQRPALLMTNGSLYAAFGSMTDAANWYGWVFAYDVGKLKSGTAQTPLQWLSTPGRGASQGGIWQAGAGLAADSMPSIYLTTGNGSTSSTNLSDSVVSLSTGSGLSTGDYFTPDNEYCLSPNDIDVGSGGPVLQTFGTNSYVFAAGKEGRVYVLNQHPLTTGNTHYSYTSNPIKEDFFAVTSAGTADQDSFTGQPVAWDGGSGTGVGSVYLGGNSTLNSASLHVSQYPVSPTSGCSGTGYSASPLCQTTNGCSVSSYPNDTSSYGQTGGCAKASYPSPECGVPEYQYSYTAGAGPIQGAWMSLSANNSVIASGVLWVAHNTANSVSGAQPGFLRALNADYISNSELWDSTLNPVTDDLSIDGGMVGSSFKAGTFNGSKYVAPTVANGRVYAPTFSPDDPTNTIPAPAGTNGFAPYIRAYGLNGKCLKFDSNSDCCDDRTVCCTIGKSPPCTNQ